MYRGGKERQSGNERNQRGVLFIYESQKKYWEEYSYWRVGDLKPRG